MASADAGHPPLVCAVDDSRWVSTAELLTIDKGAQILGHLPPVPLFVEPVLGDSSASDHPPSNHVLYSPGYLPPAVSPEDHGLTYAAESFHRDVLLNRPDYRSLPVTGRDDR
jgi:hypothetical protein